MFALTRMANQLAALNEEAQQLKTDQARRDFVNKHNPPPPVRAPVVPISAPDHSHCSRQIADLSQRNTTLQNNLNTANSEKCALEILNNKQTAVINDYKNNCESFITTQNELLAQLKESEEQKTTETNLAQNLNNELEKVRQELQVTIEKNETNEQVIKDNNAEIKLFKQAVKDGEDQKAEMLAKFKAEKKILKAKHEQQMLQLYKQIDGIQLIMDKLGIDNSQPSSVCTSAYSTANEETSDEETGF